MKNGLLFGLLLSSLTFAQTQQDALNFNCTNVGQTGISPGQCSALKSLFLQTNGQNWLNKANWFSNYPVDQWHGVDVVGGQVTNIYLSGNRLIGTIPTSINYLIGLQRLNLSRGIGTYNSEPNQLSGSIPSSIGSLAQLKELNLSGNLLSGSIPSSLGNLSQLELLDIYNNQLSGSIPSSLGNLSQLWYLYLGQNQLSGSIPSSLGNLSLLRYLGLFNNQLSGPIPASIGNLSQLVAFYLSNNQLSGQLPSTLNNLTNLVWLDADNNSLSGSFPNISELSGTIARINLSSNYLSGSINPNHLPDVLVQNGGRAFWVHQNCLNDIDPALQAHFNTMNIEWLSYYQQRTVQQCTPQNGVPNVLTGPYTPIYNKTTGARVLPQRTMLPGEQMVLSASTSAALDKEAADARIKVMSEAKKVAPVKK
jgi:Leucine-rich repeat (LRR) protein